VLENKGFIRTSLRMPLPLRATPLRAWETPIPAYYLNYLGIAKEMNEPVIKVMAASFTLINWL
jgi:hypothetical protein